MQNANLITFDVIALMATVLDIVKRTEKYPNLLPVSVYDFNENDSSRLYYNDKININSVIKKTDENISYIDYPLIYKYDYDDNSPQKYIYYNDKRAPFKSLINIFVRKESNKDPYIVIEHNDDAYNHLDSFFPMSQIIVIKDGQMQLMPVVHKVIAEPAQLYHQ